MAEQGKPRVLKITGTLGAEAIRDMGGNFCGLAFPEGISNVCLNREQAKALAAFLAHWSASASPSSDYLDGAELADSLANLAPWLG